MVRKSKRSAREQKQKPAKRKPEKMSHPSVLAYVLTCIVLLVTPMKHLSIEMRNFTAATFQLQQQDQVQEQLINNTTYSEHGAGYNSSNSSRSSSSNITTDPPRNHPHAGARYRNGTWGYVADVTRIRRRMLERFENHQKENPSTAATSSVSSYLPQVNTAEMLQICNNFWLYNQTEIAWRMTTEKLTSMVTADPAFGLDAKSRVLCAVYTHSSAKSHSRVKGITETWGWRCDGFFAASTETIEDPQDPGYGAIDLPHYGEEGYFNMWQKTRSIVAYMYDNYLDDFDYFYLCGDDTHLIVENLRYHLHHIGADQNPDTMLYMGAFIRSQGFDFVHGGGGYVLNRKTLKMLVEVLLPTCAAGRETSSEDRMMGQCLMGGGRLNENATEHYNKSVDETNAQLFFVTDPISVVVSKYTNTTRAYHIKVMARWTELFGFREGLDLMSNRSIAFHNFKYREFMMRQSALVYGGCPKGTLIGNLKA